MKLPKIRTIVDYTDYRSKNTMPNILEQIEAYRFKEDPFDYFFEVFENETVVVFAALSGYDLMEEDITEGYGRAFQLETLVVAKNPEDPQWCGKAIWMGDNNGYDRADELLGNLPVWTMSELRAAGILEFKQMSRSVPEAYRYDWQYSLEHQAQ